MHEALAHALTCLEMTRPRPVPPKRRVVEESPWLKGRKRRLMRSPGIPIPVSRTETRSWWVGAQGARHTELAGRKAERPPPGTPTLPGPKGPTEEEEEEWGPSGVYVCASRGGFLECVRRYLWESSVWECESREEENIEGAPNPLGCACSPSVPWVGSWC